MAQKDFSGPRRRGPTDEPFKASVRRLVEHGEAAPAPVGNLPSRATHIIVGKTISPGNCSRVVGH